MDQLSKLGFRVGESSLINMTKSEFDPTSVDYSKVVRKGSGFSPREALEDQLAKGGVGMPTTTVLSVPVDQISAMRTAIPNTHVKKDYLKDNNGEQFHDDNDKVIEGIQNEEEEIRLSFSSSDLWSKAFLETDSTAHYLDKSFPKPMPAKPSMVAKKTPKPPEEIKQEAAQKKELMGDTKKAEPALPEGVKKKDFNKIAGLHENSPGVLEKKKVCKSELDDAFGWMETIAKSDYVELEEKSPEQKKEAVRKEEKKEVKPKDNFVKSVGPGGIVFDFGAKTGNWVADNATDLLNQCSDRQQANISVAQRNNFSKSIEDYVKMGDRAYMMKQGEADSSNLFDPHGRLDKGMDQQVVEAYKNGEFEDMKPINQNFSKSQVRVAGEIVGAMSETDAAVVEMMKGMMDAQNEGGAVTLKQSIVAGE